MTLCNTCEKADVSCPIYPQDTKSCVEYVPLLARERFARHHGITIDDAAVKFAGWFPKANVYSQGFTAGCCGIWLRLGDGQQTMIGYGTPDEALIQAKAALFALISKAVESAERFKKG